MQINEPTLFPQHECSIFPDNRTRIVWQRWVTRATAETRWRPSGWKTFGFEILNFQLHRRNEYCLATERHQGSGVGLTPIYGWTRWEWCDHVLVSVVNIWHAGEGSHYMLAYFHHDVHCRTVKGVFPANGRLVCQTSTTVPERNKC